MAEWLIIRPVFDEVCEITFEEAQDVIDYFGEKGISYIDLAKEDAVREKVEKVLEEEPFIKIAHYDHGSEDAIYGNDSRPVIDLDNVNLLAARDCYNNNCSSAKNLGVKAWKLGATFWGYTNVFVFTTDSLEEFKIAVNYGIKRNVDGFSWTECLQKTKEKMTELIQKLVDTGRGLAASCMRWDREHLVCYNAESPPEADCWFRRQAIHLFGARIGWRIPNPFGLLKKVPSYVWLVVLAVAIAETLFWVGSLQQDSMFWSVCSLEEQAMMWIPEFGLTYRDSFILFFNLAVVGCHILVALIIWLTARIYKLRS